MTKTFAILYCLVCLLSCKKGSDSVSPTIFGNWAFKNQISGVFQFPYPYPEIYWSQSLQPLAVNSYTNDSVSLNLNTNGNFSGFIPGHNSILTGGVITYLPAISYSGTFTKLNDSIILVHPDTSMLLQFSYVKNQTLPFPHSDTIYFKQSTNDSLTFIQSWVVGSELNVSYSGLKRK